MPRFRRHDRSHESAVGVSTKPGQAQCGEELMRSPTLLTLALLALGCGPMGPVPGERLSGKVAASPPSDWSSVDKEETVQFETRPSDPRRARTHAKMAACREARPI